MSWWEIYRKLLINVSDTVFISEKRLKISKPCSLQTLFSLVLRLPERFGQHWHGPGKLISVGLLEETPYCVCFGLRFCYKTSSELKTKTFTAEKAQTIVSFHRQELVTGRGCELPNFLQPAGIDRTGTSLSWSLRIVDQLLSWEPWKMSSLRKPFWN